MRHVSKQVLMGFLFGLLFLFSQTVFARDVFVSIAKKGAIDYYLDRFATPNYHIFLTLKPFPNAIRTASVEEKEGYQLFMVEFNRAVSQKLPGELMRFGQFALISVPRHSTMVQQLFHSSLYVYPISRVERRYTQYPTVIPTGRMSPGVQQVTIDPAFLKSKLEQFSGAVPTEIDGKTVTIAERGSNDGRTLARAFLAQEYRKLGFKVSVHEYGSNKAANFIAEKQGEDQKHFVIISSHLDSVNNPGADDNGSGTISMLAVAQALSKFRIKYSLRVLAFDQEEGGLIGSKAYASSLDKSGDMANLIGVFDIDMDAYQTKNDGGFHVIDCKENTSAQLSKLIVDALAARSIPLKRVDACTNRSDHAVFWKYNKPSIISAENFFGGDGNRCYHKQCDKTDLLDFKYMSHIALANAVALSAILEAK